MSTYHGVSFWRNLVFYINLGNENSEKLNVHTGRRFHTPGIGQWFSTFHGLWPPSPVNWRIINNIVTLGFCNITIELFSKSLCSCPPENRSVAPKENRSVAPKENRSVAPKENRSVAPKEDRSVAPKEDRSVAPKENRSVASKEDRVTGLRNSGMGNKISCLQSSKWQHVQFVPFSCIPSRRSLRAVRSPSLDNDRQCAEGTASRTSLRKTEQRFTDRSSREECESDVLLARSTEDYETWSRGGSVANAHNRRTKSKKRIDISAWVHERRWIENLSMLQGEPNRASGVPAGKNKFQCVFWWWFADKKSWEKTANFRTDKITRLLPKKHL